MKTNNSCVAPRNTLSRRCTGAKKATSVLLSALGACMVFAMQASAAEVDPSNFITVTGTVLRALIIMVGAGLAVFGVINLLEGYGNDNAAANAHG